VDEFVPEERVRESAMVFERMGANVTLRVYPGMDHVVNDDEIAMAKKILQGVALEKEAGSWPK
jgi:predicted esterase